LIAECKEKMNKPLSYSPTSKCGCKIKVCTNYANKITKIKNTNFLYKFHLKRRHRRRWHECLHLTACHLKQQKYIARSKKTKQPIFFFYPRTIGWKKKNLRATVFFSHDSYLFFIFFPSVDQKKSRELIFFLYFFLFSSFLV